MSTQQCTTPRTTARRSARAVAALAVAVAFFLVAAPGANAATWIQENLDGHQVGPNGQANADIGYHPASTIWNNGPHAWYYDTTNKDLRHAWWNGLVWNFETLDGNTTTGGRTTNDVGRYNAAAVWGGTPHVWYYDTTEGNLRHAWWSGTTWLYETLDGSTNVTTGRVNADVGIAISVTSWKNEPHVWYHDVTNGNLRHGWWNGSNWIFETLDGACSGPCTNGRIDANLGRHSSVTVWGGTPHVWYHDETGGNLRHGWWNGTAWLFETLDGAGGANGRVDANVGPYTSVVIMPPLTVGGASLPHVFYLDDTNDDLRHGWWTGTTWSFETLDGNCTSGPCLTRGAINGSLGFGSTAITYGTLGLPYVFYYSPTGNAVRAALFNGTSWTFQNTDSLGGFPLAVNPDGGKLGSAIVFGSSLHLFWYDQNNTNLAHSWYG